MSDVLDKRRYPRVAPPPPSIEEGIPPGHPLIVNVSREGACLWLGDFPAGLQELAPLQIQWHGQDRVLRSRLVWLRPCMATFDRENPFRTDGWLAGYAFAEGNGGTLLADISDDISHASDIAVSFGGEIDAPVIRQREGETPGVIAFSEKSIRSIKAATTDLLPIFAKHFANVRLIFERDRLDVSASFRPLAELNPLEARRRDHRTIQPSQAAPPPAPMRIEQPATLVQPKGARWGAVNRRRLGLIAVASLAAVILGWPLLGNLRKSGDTPATPALSVGRGSIPDWSPGLQETSLGGWIEIQKRFDLPDATVRSAIQILRKNDKYSSGQMLHDLAQYPTEVRRAFSLLASQQTGTRFDFGPLENDLKARMVEGARFPDEPPGGHHSPLQRESFNNVVCLAIIELFHRRQNDPSVKDILAVLRRGRT